MHEVGHGNNSKDADQLRGGHENDRAVMTSYCVYIEPRVEDHQAVYSECETNQVLPGDTTCIIIPTRFRSFGGGDDWLLRGSRPCGAGVATICPMSTIAMIVFV